jgi:transposase
MLWSASHRGTAGCARLAALLRARSRPGTGAFLEHRLTNGLAEGTNNKIRLLSHRAFGFH